MSKKCKGHKKGKVLRWHVYRNSGPDRLGWLTRRLVCCAPPAEAVRKYLSISRRIRHGDVYLVGRTRVIGHTKGRTP